VAADLSLELGQRSGKPDPAPAQADLATERGGGSEQGCGGAGCGGDA